MSAPLTPEHLALEQKRKKAVQYLRSRNINRADPHCAHRYDSDVTAPPPRFDVSPSSIAPRKELETIK